MKMLTVMSNLQKLPCGVSDGFPTTDLQTLLAIKLANLKIMNSYQTFRLLPHKHWYNIITKKCRKNTKQLQIDLISWFFTLGHDSIPGRNQSIWIALLGTVFSAWG